MCPSNDLLGTSKCRIRVCVNSVVPDERGSSVNLTGCQRRLKPSGNATQRIGKLKDQSSWFLANGFNRRINVNPGVKLVGKKLQHRVLVQIGRKSIDVLQYRALRHEFGSPGRVAL